MSHSDRSKATVIIITAAAAIASFFLAFSASSQAQIPQANQTQTVPPPPLSHLGNATEFSAVYDAREKVLIEKVNTDPSLLQYTRGAMGLNMEFVPATIFGEATDKMYVDVHKDRSVVGDWKTSYNVTYSNNFKIEMDFVGDQKINTKVTRVPDETFYLTYSEEQKSLIELALQNATVQELLGGKDWYVRNIYSSIGFAGDDRCPLGSCHSITIDQNSRQETLGVAVNSTTGKVVFIGNSPGW